MRSFGWREMCPSVGTMSPSSSLRKVLLPAPFGPMMAIRESQSTPKFRSVYSGGLSGSYPNAMSTTEMHGGGSRVAAGKDRRR